MADRGGYEQLNDGENNDVDVDLQQALLAAVAELNDTPNDAEASIQQPDDQQLKTALREFLVSANITLEDDKLVNKLAELIISRPSPEASIEFTQFIIRQYTYSGLQELLRLIAIPGLGAWSYYVARLFGQLAIEATIVLGEQTGYTLLTEDERLHTILGQCSVIASMAVYIRFGHDTATAEYKALRHFLDTKEINWKNFAMRMMAIIPSACMGIIAYARNPLFYSLSLTGFLYCLLAPSMAGLNQMSLRQKALGLLVGAPTMAHFITPFTFETKYEGVTITLHYVFGIIAVLTFPQFARLGTMEWIAQAEQDVEDIRKYWANGEKFKSVGLGLLDTAKWLLNTTIGSLSGLPTAMMGYLLLDHYGWADNPFIVVSVMGFCAVTGNQCNQPTLNHFTYHCKAYLSHLIWETPKNLATLPESCYYLWAWARGDSNPQLERIEAQVTKQDEIQPLKSDTPFRTIQ